jgi:hypothetical protein
MLIGGCIFGLLYPLDYGLLVGSAYIAYWLSQECTVMKLNE